MIHLHLTYMIPQIDKKNNDDCREHQDNDKVDCFQHAAADLKVTIRPQPMTHSHLTYMIPQIEKTLMFAGCGFRMRGRS